MTIIDAAKKDNKERSLWELGAQIPFLMININQSPPLGT